MEVLWKKFGTIEVSNTGLVKTRINKNGFIGCIDPHGYCVTRINRKKIYIHRLVAHLFMEFDLDSNYQIDHINGNRSDNRVENLRIVNQTENNLNQQCHRNGKPKFVNISSNPINPYRVQIQGFHVGYFKTLVEANEAADYFYNFGRRTEQTSPRSENEYRKHHCYYQQT